MNIGDRVHTKRNSKEVGKVRELIETTRGPRALVAWPDHTEQFVDLADLVVKS